MTRTTETLYAQNQHTAFWSNRPFHESDYDKLLGRCIQAMRRDDLSPAELEYLTSTYLCLKAGPDFAVTTCMDAKRDRPGTVTVTRISLGLRLVMCPARVLQEQVQEYTKDGHGLALDIWTWYRTASGWATASDRQPYWDGTPWDLDALPLERGNANPDPAPSRNLEEIVEAARMVALCHVDRNVQQQHPEPEMVEWHLQLSSQVGADFEIQQLTVRTDNLHEAIRTALQFANRVLAL